MRSSCLTRTTSARCSRTTTSGSPRPRGPRLCWPGAVCKLNRVHLRRLRQPLLPVDRPAVRRHAVENVLRQRLQRHRASCPHLDIPWTFVCDAGRGASYVQDFLALPCKENEGALLKGGHWGCTVKGAATNKDALVTLTNHTFVFGRKTGESAFRQAPVAADCAADKIPLENCGWLNMMEHGCHQNMGITSPTARLRDHHRVCHSGFALLFIGSLWQPSARRSTRPAHRGELRENKSSGCTGHHRPPRRRSAKTRLVHAALPGSFRRSACRRLRGAKSSRGTNDALPLPLCLVGSGGAMRCRISKVGRRLFSVKELTCFYLSPVFNRLLLRRLD